MASKQDAPLLVDTYRYMKKSDPESTYGSYGYNWAKKIDTTKMNNFNKRISNIHQNIKVYRNTGAENDSNQQSYPPQHTLRVGVFNQLRFLSHFKTCHGHIGHVSPYGSRKFGE
jgi:hypothetical protein